MLLSWLALQLTATAAFGDSNTNSSSEDWSGTSRKSGSAEVGATTDERVAQLTAQLERSSSNEKAKLSAIAALARLGDRRAVKPLTGALQDNNPTVRALAAAALGKLGQKSAMPALRQASSDSNETVRARVADAITSISKANGLTHTASTTAGFGKQARITEQSPDLYVVLKSFNDDSPGKSEKKERLTNADVVRTAMSTELRGAPLVTAVANEAKRLGLNPRVVDVSVVKMKLRTTKNNMLEVETELRLAISDDSGKMLSFLSGGAKVQVPKKGFNWSYLPQLRKEALENAVRGLFGKLITHLRTTVAA